MGSPEPDVADRRYCCVCIGNPGSGKSTLLNSLIGEQGIFKSGLSFGKGMTQDMQESRHQGISYIDTPGLADATLREAAAAAITKALKRNTKYKIIFVVTLEGLYVRPQDRAMLETVLAALESALIKEGFPENGYGVVVNKVHENRAQSAPQESADLDEPTLSDQDKAECAQRLFPEGRATTHIAWLLEEQSLGKNLLKLKKPWEFFEGVPTVNIDEKLVKPVVYSRFEEIEKELKAAEDKNKQLVKEKEQLEEEERKALAPTKSSKREEQTSQPSQQHQSPERRGMHRAETRTMGLTDEVIVRYPMRIEDGSFEAGSKGRVVQKGSEQVTIDFDKDRPGIVVKKQDWWHLWSVEEFEREQHMTTRKLAQRGITVSHILDLYAKLGTAEVMQEFNADESTTVDVVYGAVLPLTQGSGVSYSELVNTNPEPLLAERMVSHNWSNKFSHLVASIVADAMDSVSFAWLHEALKAGRATDLRNMLRQRGRSRIVYWVCAFSVNQHLCICKSERSRKDKQFHCKCSKTNISNNSPDCEMDKFDHMMELLFTRSKDREATEAPSESRHVIAVDQESKLFTRAWVVAELVVAICMKVKVDQRYIVYDEAALLEQLKFKKIDIMECEASRPEDKEHVINKAKKQIAAWSSARHAQSDQNLTLEKSLEAFHEELDRKVRGRLQETMEQVEKEALVPHIWCIGNAQVGKSTLLNMMIGCSLSEGNVCSKDGQRKIHVREHGGTKYIEALGLADPQRCEEAAKAITTAMQAPGSYKVFFVITLDGGRVRTEDSVTIAKVLEAAPLGQMYTVIINKADRDTVRNLANPANRKAIADELFKGFAAKQLDATAYLAWVEKGATELPEGLVEGAPDVPLMRAMVGAVDGETPEKKLNERREEVRKVKGYNEKLARDIERMKQRMKNKLQHVALQSMGAVADDGCGEALLRYDALFESPPEVKFHPRFKRDEVAFKEDILKSGRLESLDYTTNVSTPVTVHFREAVPLEKIGITFFHEFETRFGSDQPMDLEIAASHDGQAFQEICRIQDLAPNEESNPVLTAWTKVPEEFSKLQWKAVRLHDQSASGRQLLLFFIHAMRVAAE